MLKAIISDRKKKKNDILQLGQQKTYLRIMEIHFTSKNTARRECFEFVTFSSNQKYPTETNFAMLIFFFNYLPL